MFKKHLSDTAFALILFGIIPTAPAHAYLDGGTVSLVLQAVAGAVASVLLFGKMYWAKIKRFFKRSSGSSPD